MPDAMRRIYLRRGDWLGILLVIALLGGFGALAVTGYLRLSPNRGFGPDWNCSDVGQGDPVCVNPPRKPQ